MEKEEENNEMSEEEKTRQFCNLVNRPQIDDSEQQSWEEACEYFEKSQGRQPNLLNDKDILAVSGIQLGILETYKKYKLL